MRDYSSFLTRRFDSALQLASSLHHDQPRKETSVPYIAHLLGVCSLVLEAGGDEDQAIAAILHDAVEDQGGLPTLNTIRRLFGDRVAEIVAACSDSTEPDPSNKPSWQERKTKYLAHLRDASPDAILIAAADKLHNARAILAAYGEIGEDVFKRFKASKKDVLQYYASLVEILREKEAPKRLVGELETVVQELHSLAGVPLNPSLA
jgi:(p)ppGpp synthase/HD superfamily hydrolase